MNESIQNKLAIEIASKSIRIATLEAEKEELKAQLEQALTHNQELENPLETSTAPETEKGE